MRKDYLAFFVSLFLSRLAALELGIKARIVMPATTPELKVLGVRSRITTTLRVS